ncbi:hypothetical protein J2Z60_001898 [Lactobacillus colini]|uniref:MFS transporter n=1 Tax=Lactobacillus colini TaxID=1819254 RepID=A0ABS4MG85_9LACO|nr:hypothetical protein [Lactobacillus colini]MBP2058709.1 hypothetical protein [Lactobacillus colini]
MKEINLVISKTASLIGTQFFSVFLSLWIVNNFSKASMLSLSLSLTSVVTIAFTLFGGVASASTKIIKNLCLLDLLSMIICIFSAIMWLFESTSQLATYIILTVVNSVLSLNSSFSGPIFKKLTGVVVAKDKVLKYNEILSASKEIVRLVVPTLASFMFALGMINAFIALSINGFSFLASFISLYNLGKYDIFPDNVQQSKGSHYREAITALFKDKDNLKKFSNIFLLYIFIAGINILAPYYSVHVFKSSWLYGVLESSQSFGAILAVLTFKFYKVDISMRKERLGLVLSAICMALVVPTQSKALFIIGIAILAYYYLRYNVAFESYMQLGFKNSFLGEIYSLYYGLISIATLIGNTLIGALGDYNANLCFLVTSVAIGLINCSVLISLMGRKNESL